MAPEIALVEDELSMRRALTRLLSSVGYSVHAFSTAEALLAAGLGPEVGCLVADIHLGEGMNGLALCERLRAAGSTLPVIIISGHDDPATRKFAQQVGANAYLRKPFAAATFVDAVRAAMAAGPP